MSIASITVNASIAVTPFAFERGCGWIVLSGWFVWFFELFFVNFELGNLFDEDRKIEQIIPNENASQFVIIYSIKL